jgi:tetratricopeptide (TPR) repeat protein
VPILRWLPGFSILFAFAVAGAVAVDWRDRRAWVIAIYTALAAATCIFLVVGARYRIPLALGLALFGGAIATVRSRRRLVAAAVAGVIAALFTRMEAVPSAHNFAEEWALSAQSLLKENQIAEAEAAARRASDIDPNNVLAWDARGSVLAAAGRRSEAADAFRRALILNAQFAAAHQHLATLLAESGDVAGAAAEHRRVIAIDPRNVISLSTLARLDGALGNAAEGLAAARRAASLKTPDDDDWLIIAMLAGDLRRFDEAEEALAHIGENTPRVEQVREAIRRARN